MNINEMYANACKNLYLRGEETSPRGQKTKEILNFQMKMETPGWYWITLKSRKCNFRFAIIESLCNLLGQNDPEILCFYNPNLKHFVNEKTGDFNGAYGPRVASFVEKIIEELKRDPDSRRAVINIYNSSDCYEGNSDVPCTVALQFFIRNAKLCMTVFMRSNDVLWGTGYDLGQFRFIQKSIAHLLGLQEGTYTHNATSFHYYVEREKSILDIIANQSEVVEFNPPEFSEKIKTYDDLQKQISRFFKYEEKFRKNNETVLITGLLEPFDYFYKIVTRQI